MASCVQKTPTQGTFDGEISLAKGIIITKIGLQSWTKYLEQSYIIADYFSSHLHVSTSPFHPQNNVGWHLEAKKCLATLYRG